MRVREWMSPDPMAVTPFTDVAEARALLHRYGIRHLPVTDHGRVIGMVSDRDVRITDAALQQLADRAAGLSAPTAAETAGVGVSVAAIMSTPAHAITADDDIETAARMMLSRRISAIPVVDAEHALVGIITTTDCLLASLAPETAA